MAAHALASTAIPVMQLAHAATRVGRPRAPLSIASTTSATPATTSNAVIMPMARPKGSAAPEIPGTQMREPREQGHCATQHAGGRLQPRHRLQLRGQREHHGTREHEHGEEDLEDVILPVVDEQDEARSGRCQQGDEKSPHDHPTNLHATEYH